MIPKTGDRVRLVETVGVASPAMTEQVGRVGAVLGARRQDGAVLVHARFPTADGAGAEFWLKPGEWRLAATPPEAPPAPPPKEAPVDFATTVGRELARLAEEDARIAREMTALAEERAALVRERRALEAARSAYRRVAEGVGGAPTRETPAVVFVRRWAASHGGRVVLGEAIPAAEREGVAPSSEQVRDRVTWAARRYGERVAKGVYELRGEVAS